MADSSRFFSDIVPFQSFADMCDTHQYVNAPDDWYVVLTDIQGSTKAIENGRYRDVNMVGAACIAAAINACGDIDIPYVFGGEGATFLVPPQCIDAVKSELIAVKSIARKYHDIALRLGAVSVSDIRAKNKNVGVAKYQAATGFTLAMLNGGGASLADAMIKTGDFNFGGDESDIEPDLDGLSCRWHPVQSKNGVILTLMVMVAPNVDAPNVDAPNVDASNTHDADHAIYKMIANRIHAITQDDNHPISMPNMKYKWPSFSLFRLEKMMWHKKGRVFENIKTNTYWLLVFGFMHMFNLTLKGFSIDQYRRDMIANTDYQKFDDVLRMVIDCTPLQVSAIETFLDDLYRDNKIIYGIHHSDAALITCFVKSLNSDGHVHFVDGNDGGYALAAKMMKRQLAEA